MERKCCANREMESVLIFDTKLVVLAKKVRDVCPRPHFYPPMSNALAGETFRSFNGTLSSLLYFKIIRFGGTNNDTGIFCWFLISIQYFHIISSIRNIAYRVPSVIACYSPSFFYAI